MRTPDASKATIELPLSPSVAAVIGATPWKHVRKMAVFVLVVVAAVFICAIVVNRLESTPHTRDPMAAVIGTGAVGGSLVLILFLVWVFGSWLPSRRDLREGTYLRTSGPIAFGRTKHGYTLRLADREMFMGHDVGYEIEGRRVKWAVVDYSRHTHIIFGVWDQSGKIVFLAKGHSADAPPVNS